MNSNQKMSFVELIIIILLITTEGSAGSEAPDLLGLAVEPDPVSLKSTCKRYQTKESFDQQCIQQFKGVPDGSHCFFSAGKGNWSTAWTICKNQGATLAQVHTDSEFDKITTYWNALNIGSSYGIWLALLRRTDQSGMADKDYGLSLNYSVWQDDQGKPNPVMIAGNTWVRNHVNKNDPRTNSAGCNHMPVRSGIFYFGDSYCSALNQIMCQYTGETQNFTKTNVCLAEKSPETFVATSPQDCADTCSKRAWCRGFNYVLWDAGGCNITCQLSPWSINDSTPNSPKINTSPDHWFYSCTYYNYIP